MEEQQLQKNIEAPGDDAKFSKLPDHVYAWLFSVEAADEIGKIAQSFSLEKEKTSLLAKIAGQVILKEIPLEKFPIAIKQFLVVDNETTQKLSIITAIKEFLPVRDYLKDTEKFIVAWGGNLPAILPLIFQPKSAQPPTAETPINKVTPPPVLKVALTQKSLRQIVQDNKEILNQVLTTTPLKIADFDQPVRGTIKNWLADYVKQKGAAKHDSMIRGDYLFKSDNAKNLSSQEKLLVAEILKSYDENSALTYDETNKIVIMGSAEKKSPEISKIPDPVSPPKNSSSPYREPIEKKDLSSSAFSPPKATPQIDGHVINLKDLQ